MADLPRNDSKTAMRLGSELMIHVKKYLWEPDDFKARNMIQCWSLKTNRKAKYDSVFCNRVMFGFFCAVKVNRRCRSPPSWNFFEKESEMEESKLKNDYKKNTFWVTYDKNNQPSYYLCLKWQRIKVTKEVYSVCKNSYQKMYRDKIRERDTVAHYENADDFYPYMDTKPDIKIMDYIMKKDQKLLLQKAIDELSPEEQRIIFAIYFEEMTERDLADELQMSQQKLHYRKKKILEKLRIFLSKGN